jgi:hypothetical protein
MCVVRPVRLYMRTIVQYFIGTVATRMLIRLYIYIYTHTHTHTQAQEQLHTHSHTLLYNYVCV